MKAALFRLSYSGMVGAAGIEPATSGPPDRRASAALRSGTAGGNRTLADTRMRGASIPTVGGVAGDGIEPSSSLGYEPGMGANTLPAAPSAGLEPAQCPGFGGRRSVRLSYEGSWHPHQESNPDLPVRSRTLYPLSYAGMWRSREDSNPNRPD